MIAHISGEVAEKFLNSVIIDVHGVGYEVILSAIDFEQLKLGDTVKLYTHHHVREQSEDLFGFSLLSAKKLFQLLIGVQGIGPKNAMAILSLAPTESVRNAIANADASFIAKANGVGKRSAERVIVDLREKVGLPSVYGRKVDAAILDSSKPADDEALEALIALGFPLADATMALEGVEASLPVEERIRLALKNRAH
ncbi:Holliday junction branch migration protein RuvA [Candidatus Saccharibacteria bacterium]|nr:Holliday junction branch migration protein RuvA [Candidatus Saccharibacteria bacterium]